MSNNDQLDKLNKIFAEEIAPILEENPELVDSFMEKVESYRKNEGKEAKRKGIIPLNNKPVTLSEKYVSKPTQRLRELEKKVMSLFD